MARGKYLHFRADEDLIARIDALAEQANANRSEIMRRLLHEALGNDASRTAVRQAAIEFRQRVIERLKEVFEDLAAEE